MGELCKPYLPPYLNTTCWAPTMHLLFVQWEDGEAGGDYPSLLVPLLGNMAIELVEKSVVIIMLFLVAVNWEEDSSFLSPLTSMVVQNKLVGERYFP